MSRLSPCPSCQLHVLVGERVCPHCGVSLRTSNARVPALLVGLALTGCPDNVEPVYGSPDSGQPSEESESDTSTDTETDTSETDTSETDTTTVGEPEYGVPDSG